MKVVLLLSLLSFSSLAADLRIKDYNWNMTDIASQGLTKEALFTRMDRDFVKPKSSICSNRAHMWVNDFKRDHNIDSGKIFLFYTEKKSGFSLKTWWYHVAPIINENGNFWVMDAGFGSWLKTPVTPQEWLEKFTRSTKGCKEISASETELVELIFSERAFPAETSYGYNDCYYKIVPHTIWTPEVLAQNLLGKDASGKPVRVERDEINKNELLQACMEATSTKFGWALGSSKEKCKEYIAR